MKHSESSEMNIQMQTYRLNQHGHLRVDWQYFTSNGTEYFCDECALAGRLDAFVVEFGETHMGNETEISVTGAPVRMVAWLAARPAG